MKSSNTNNNHSNNTIVDANSIPITEISLDIPLQIHGQYIIKSYKSSMRNLIFMYFIEKRSDKYLTVSDTTKRKNKKDKKSKKGKKSKHSISDSESDVEGLCFFSILT